MKCCRMYVKFSSEAWIKYFFSYLIWYRVAHLVCTSVFPPASRSILFIWPEDFGVGWRRTNKTLLFVFSQCFTSLTSFMIIDDWNDWVCIWRCQQCFYECLACFWLYGELFLMIHWVTIVDKTAGNFQGHTVHLEIRHWIWCNYERLLSTYFDMK